MSDERFGWMRGPRETVLAVVLYLVVFGLAVRLPGWLHYPRGRFVPPSVLTHAIMAAASLGLAALMTRGWRRRLALSLGSYRFSPRILLRVLLPAVPSTLAALSGRTGKADPLGMSPLRAVLFIWILSSFCEELFARGFLQGHLAMEAQRGTHLFGRWFLGVPVWVSAILFGLGHLVLWPVLGAASIPICVSAAVLGLIAGYYRQETGSLLPAFLVHLLFNVGGSVPGWLIGG